MNGNGIGRRYASVAIPLLIPLLLFSRRDSFGDEHAVVANALNFLAHRTLVPVNASYPTLYSYLATPLVVMGAIGAWVAGLGGSVRDAVARSLAEDRWPLVIGPRLLSIELVGAAAWMVTVTARRRFGDWAALVAAAALLSSHATLVEGTYGLPDSLVLFLCAVSFGLVVRHAETDDAKLLRWAAAAAGLATAAKYNAACSIVPVIFALVRPGASSAGRRAAPLGELAWCAGAFGLAFICGTPGWLLAPKLFADGLRFEIDHGRVGHLGAAGVPLAGQLELLVRETPVTLVLGVAGLWLGLRRRDRIAGLTAVSVASGLLMAATSHKQSVQYLFPIVPALGDAAAGAVAGLARAKAKAGLLAVGAALGLCAGADLSAGLRAALRTSTTQLATRWIEANVRPGSSVALENNYVPRLYSSQVLVKLAADPVKGGPSVAAWLAGRHNLYALEDIASDPSSLLAIGGPDLIVTSDQAYDRFFSSGLFTMRPPVPGSPLWSAFVAKREFYRQLFSSPDWTEVLDLPAGNGPRTRVFARRALAMQTPPDVRWPLTRAP